MREYIGECSHSQKIHQYSNDPQAIDLIGTQGRTRTGTTVKSGDFESPASTIPPLGHADETYHAMSLGVGAVLVKI